MKNAADRLTLVRMPGGYSPDRYTEHINRDARLALDDLVKRCGQNRMELVSKMIVFAYDHADVVSEIKKDE